MLRRCHERKRGKGSGYGEMGRKCVSCRGTVCRDLEASRYLEWRSSSKRVSEAEGAWCREVESEVMGAQV